MEHQTSSQAPQEQFAYQQLDDNPNSIRLIRVAPAQADERVRISIVHADTNKSYRCLSYMWGTGPDDYDVTIDGRAFKVRENLYRFLCMASHRFSGQLLWIDALCINQTDSKEKGHQVERMGAIYRDAQETLVWLGENGDFGRLLDTSQAGPQNRRLSAESIFETEPEQRNLSEGFRTLCTNPYWDRIWI
ncbi:HET-domain-containing protein, partial [Lentithecium fluviatile CBS 122367]